MFKGSHEIYKKTRRLLKEIHLSILNDKNFHLEVSETVLFSFVSKALSFVWHMKIIEIVSHVDKNPKIVYLTFITNIRKIILSYSQEQ